MIFRVITINGFYTRFRYAHAVGNTLIKHTLFPTPQSHLRTHSLMKQASSNITKKIRVSRPVCFATEAGQVFSPLKALKMIRNGQAHGLNILNCFSAKFHENTKFRVNDHAARQATKPK